MSSRYAWQRTLQDGGELLQCASGLGKFFWKLTKTIRDQGCILDAGDAAAEVQSGIGRGLLATPVDKAQSIWTPVLGRSYSWSKSSLRGAELLLWHICACKIWLSSQIRQYSAAGSGRLAACKPSACGFQPSTSESECPVVILARRMPGIEPPFFHPNGSDVELRCEICPLKCHRKWRVAQLSGI